MIVSIITVNFNDAVGLERTIKSVISQTCPKKEFIIVDGSSSDGSIDVIKKYSDSINKWVSEPDSGIYNAMNKGIRMATGDYCIMMNAGDVFYSDDVLEKVKGRFETGKEIYNGNALYVCDGKIKWYRKCQRDISTLFFYTSSICHQATFIKTSLLKKLQYDESYRMVSDWKFWVEAICLNHVEYEAMNIDVCCFDWSGITTKNHDLGIRERQMVLESLFTAAENEKYKKLSEKKDYLKYIKDGICFWFWYYYACLFKIKKIRKYN